MLLVLDEGAMLVGKDARGLFEHFACGGGSASARDARPRSEVVAPTRSSKPQHGRERPVKTTPEVSSWRAEAPPWSHEPQARARTRAPHRSERAQGTYREALVSPRRLVPLRCDGPADVRPNRTGCCARGQSPSVRWDARALGSPQDACARPSSRPACGSSAAFACPCPIRASRPSRMSMRKGGVAPRRHPRAP